MRVLWVINLILPAFAASQGLTASVREGWLSGLYRAVRGTMGAETDFSLCIAYPEPPDETISDRIEWDGVVWYGFREDLKHPEKYDARMEQRFSGILADAQPDIVHVFGTEFPHAGAALKAFGRPERSLVGIQGICTRIAECYMAGLPEDVQREVTIRDFLKRDSLRQQQKKFAMRGERERETVALAGHITGRTAFDEHETGLMHPGRVYHPMNETLREEFYTGQWEKKGVIPHRIFLSQGDYPLKGFHYLLMAVAELLREEPDTYGDLTVAVAGNSVIGGNGSRIPLFLKIGTYGKYLRRLIEEEQLADHVEMLGSLSASQMKEEMLKAGLFACPSELENSPNSMGEAMLLGVPVVASDTGGIPSLLKAGREGILVRPGDIHGLAEAIRQIFDEPMIASLYGENARKRALVTHDPEKNLRRLFEIYGEICEEPAVTEQ